MSRLAFFLLTEDHSDDAFATVQALLRRMLFLVAPQHDPRRLSFAPSTDDARAAMRGNGWRCVRSKNTRDQRKAIDLRRTLATHLLQDCFVVVHIDGDVAFSDPEGSANLRDFDTLLRPGILLLLKDQADRIDRLLLFAPYYSIESWLYQNTAEAHRVYAEHHDRHPRAKQDREKLARWAADRTQLDELLKPKDELIIGAGFNRRLAETAYPAQAVAGAERSFHQTVERLRACAPLRQALEGMPYGANL